MRLHTLMEFIKCILQLLRRLNSLWGSGRQNKDQLTDSSRSQVGIQKEEALSALRAGQHQMSPRRLGERPAGSGTWCGHCGGQWRARAEGHTWVHFPILTSKPLESELIFLNLCSPISSSVRWWPPCLAQSDVPWVVLLLFRYLELGGGFLPLLVSSRTGVPQTLWPPLPTELGSLRRSRTDSQGPTLLALSLGAWLSSGSLPSALISHCRRFYSNGPQSLDLEEAFGGPVVPLMVG